MYKYDYKEQVKNDILSSWDDIIWIVEDCEKIDDLVHYLKIENVEFKKKITQKNLYSNRISTEELTFFVDSNGLLLLEIDIDGCKDLRIVDCILREYVFDKIIRDVVLEINEEHFNCLIDGCMFNGFNSKIKNKVKNYINSKGLLAHFDVIDELCHEIYAECEDEVEFMDNKKLEYTDILVELKEFLEKGILHYDPRDKRRMLIYRDASETNPQKYPEGWYSEYIIDVAYELSHNDDQYNAFKNAIQDFIECK